MATESIVAVDLVAETAVLSAIGCCAQSYAEFFPIQYPAELCTELAAFFVLERLGSARVADEITSCHDVRTVSSTSLCKSSG